MSAYRTFVYAWNPDVIFQAQITTTTFTYPITTFEVGSTLEGDPADVSPGMTVLFGSAAGLDDRGRGRIRLANSGSNMYIGRSSQGIRDGECNLSPTTYVTVLNHRMPWAKIPYISSNGKIIYKDEIAFVAANAQPPVANAGRHVADFVDPDTDELEVEFDATASFAVRSGASPLTYSWDFGADATPPTSTSATPTVSFPAGPPRYVSLTVDDGVLSHTTYIVVYPAPRSGNDAPLVVTEGSMRQTMNPGGQMLELDIKQVLDIPHGAVILAFQDTYEGSVKQTVASRDKLQFLGYYVEDRNRVNPGDTGVVKEGAITAWDVGTWLDHIPGFSQVVKNAASPNKWFKMADANIDRFIHYMLHWHSTALSIAPFMWSGLGSTYPFGILDAAPGSIFAQVDTLAGRIKHRFTCDQYGQLSIKPDPQRQATGSRTATVQAAVTEDDWTRLNLGKIGKSTIYWLKGSGIIASSSKKPKTAFCQAPGQSPSQGESGPDAPDLLIVDQTDLNVTIGHDYARINAEDNVYEVTLANTVGAIQPADMTWVTLTVSAANAGLINGQTLSSQRCLPQQVQVTTAFKTGQKNRQARLEKEVIGTPAVTVKLPDNKLPSFKPITEIFLPPFALNPGLDVPFLVRGTRTMAVLASNGTLYITTDFETRQAAGGPTWVGYALGLSGTTLSATLDAASPAGQRDIYVATTTGIYKVTDIFNTRGVTLQHTFATVSTLRTIESERGFPGLICVASYYAASGGTTAAITTDGSTWTEYTVTSHYNTDESSMISGNRSPSVFVSGKIYGRIRVGAFTATGSGAAATSTVYQTGDFGMSWSPLNSLMTGSRDTGVQFHVPWDDNDDSLFYWSKGLGSTTATVMRTNKNGTQTQIQPHETQQAGLGYIATCDIDRQSVACIATFPSGAIFVKALFVSRNAGANWTRRTPDVFANRWNYVFCAGDNRDVIYLLSGNGDVGYSEDFGLTIDLRSGNLPGTAFLIRLFGG